MHRATTPVVVARKQKAVVNADAQHLARIEELVRQGKYKTVSEFVREAMAEKLERLRRVRLQEQVARYHEAGNDEEEADLVAWQAFPGTKRRAKR